ncbi:phage terminase small subunit [Sutcliffiella sp. BMC8]|uniref:phage terminase small subunit n=1 Tax=Sutcliffiella sp. BMC8 TaxID=3073243 RepID=UPI0030CC888B
MAEKYVLAEKDYVKGMKYKDIAEKYDVSINTVKSWKKRYGWNREKGAPKEKGVHTKKRGAPKGNINAKGNPGGAAPKGNSNAETHGFFSKFLPEETLEIMDLMNERSPVDLIWDQIQIQYAAIIRAQKVMFVTAKDEMIKQLKKAKYEYHPRSKEEGGGVEQATTEEEYEFQFAWDRQATFLNAQSRAMSELRSLIKQFDEMAHIDDERRLKLEGMRLGIEKTKADTEFAKMRASKLRGDKKNTSMLDALIEGRKQYEEMNKERENDD